MAASDRKRVRAVRNFLDNTTEIPYFMLHTVVETPTFLRSAAASGMSDSEREAVVDYLAQHPHAGDEIKGTGGCRKLRVAGRGKGKSGGYRVISFFSGSAIPVFLLYAYSKADRSDLSAGDRNEFGRMTKVLVSTYRANISRSTK